MGTRLFRHEGEQMAWMRCFEKAIAGGKDSTQAAQYADDYLDAVYARVPAVQRVQMDAAFAKSH